MAGLFHVHNALVVQVPVAATAGLVFFAVRQDFPASQEAAR
jgi:hypothetical protein